MKLEQSFDVEAPLERVWATLIDVECVAPCLPGAEITEAGEDGTYRGTFSVRLGPTTAAYRGQLSMEDVDHDAHRAVMRASGQDKRGQGSAKATIVSAMREDGGVTRVEVETDLTITGRLARFGRGGMIQDISNRLFKDFADCLQQRIEGESASAAPADAPSPVDPTSPAGPAPTPVAPPKAAAGPAPAAKPVGGFSLFFSALLERLKRLFRR